MQIGLIDLIILLRRRKKKGKVEERRDISPQRGRHDWMGPGCCGGGQRKIYLVFALVEIKTKKGFLIELYLGITHKNYIEVK